jgi:hypothetical protein
MLLTTDLIKRIKNIGDVYLYTPSFYIKKEDILNGKTFSIDELNLNNHCHEIYNDIKDYKKIFIISHSRGNILAKFFCKLYHKKVIGYINIDGGESSEWYKEHLHEWEKKYSYIDEIELNKLFVNVKKGDDTSYDTILGFVKYYIYKQSYENNYDFKHIKMLILNNIYNDDEISIKDTEYVKTTLLSKFDFNKQYENNKKHKSIYYVGKTHLLYFYDDVVDDIIKFINEQI